MNSAPKTNEGMSDDHQNQRDCELKTINHFISRAVHVCVTQDTPIKAYDICQQAIDTMRERGKTYDKDDKQEERSMGKTVAAFNAITGQNLSEEQGWLFMVMLKMARAQQGEYKHDNYLDGTAYFALAGEAASIERKK